MNAAEEWTEDIEISEGERDRRVECFLSLLKFDISIVNNINSIIVFEKVEDS